jgi:hypothetical protein
MQIIFFQQQVANFHETLDCAAPFNKLHSQPRFITVRCKTKWEL